MINHYYVATRKGYSDIYYIIICIIIATTKKCDKLLHLSTIRAVILAPANFIALTMIFKSQFAPEFTLIPIDN